MNNSNPTVITARIFEQALVANEADLITRFLGQDMVEACNCAAEKFEPVLLATAALPLKTRQDAFRNWRKGNVRALLTRIPAFNDYFNDADPEMRAEILEGLVSFADLDVAIGHHREIKDAKRRELLNASKDALATSLLQLVIDANTEVGGLQVPRFVVVTQDGEVGLFRSRNYAVNWARERDQRYFLGPIDAAGFRIFPASCVH